MSKYDSLGAATLRRINERGQASDFISAFDLLPGQPVILCCRVSSREQNRNENLDDQIRNLEEAAARAGAEVIEVYQHVRSGSDPSWLLNPSRFANEYGAILLAESTDRFIRHPSYYPKRWPDAQAREADLQELRFCTLGVPLTTLLHPDVSPEEVRSYQRKRGQRFKNRKGGRPKRCKPGDMRRRKAEQFDEVIRLGEVEGLSHREISRLTGIPSSTIGDWLKSWTLE